MTGILHRAAETLGYACLTVRHLIDPEVIVLGGGLIEACSEYMMPILENIVGSDRLPGARDGGHVLLSALGDDAVVLGAVALARRQVGRSPFKKRYRVEPTYPEIVRFSFGEIVVGKKAYDHDIYIQVTGKVKSRDKDFARRDGDNPQSIGAKELEEVCKGGPEVLFVGCAKANEVVLTEQAQRFLAQRSIRCEIVSGRAACGRLQQLKGPQGGADPRDVRGPVLHERVYPPCPRRVLAVKRTAQCCGGSGRRTAIDLTSCCSSRTGVARLPSARSRTIALCIARNALKTACDTLTCRPTGRNCRTLPRAGNRKVSTSLRLSIRRTVFPGPTRRGRAFREKTW